MTRLSEQPAKKLRTVVLAPEQLVAAAQFEHSSEEGWRTSIFAKLAEALGLDPEQDLAHHQPEYGYLGITDRRLILARSPWFGSVQRRHVYAEAPVEDCRLSWYDSSGMLNLEARLFLFQLPEERFASVLVRTRWPGMIGKGQPEAMQALVDGVVDAFGRRATRVDEPR